VDRREPTDDGGRNQVDPQLAVDHAERVDLGEVVDLPLMPSILGGVDVSRERADPRVPASRLTLGFTCTREGVSDAWVTRRS
jgi:hypothetical protein